MLKNTTYGVWNLLVSMVCLSLGITNVMIGSAVFAVLPFALTVVFVAFSVMAFSGRGMYHKHVPTEEIKEDYGIE